MRTNVTGLALAACRIAVASGLLALASGDIANSATQVSRGTVVLWSGQDQWVKIEPQDDSAAPPNEHPAPLGTAEVANALGALRTRTVDADTGAESQGAVFTREELDNLAAPVAAGLAKAGPRQDITFSTISSRPLGGGLVRDLSVNAGRIFYQDGKLNVIFGELQSNYRKKNLYGQRQEDFDPRRQGSREQASKQKKQLSTSAGVALYATAGGRVRGDWVTINPAVAMARGESVAAAGAAPAVAAAPTAPSAAAATRKDAELERRLQTLKDLKAKGLISEEAYEAKVQQLLSEL